MRRKHFWLGLKIGISEAKLFGGNGLHMHVKAGFSSINLPVTPRQCSFSPQAQLY
jgi:hypothetical protein